MRNLLCVVMLPLLLNACGGDEEATSRSELQAESGAFMNKGLAEVLVDGAEVGADLKHQVSSSSGGSDFCHQIKLPAEQSSGVNFEIRADFVGGSRPYMNVIEGDGTNWGDTLALEGVATMRGLYTNDLTVCLGNRGSATESLSYTLTITSLY